LGSVSQSGEWNDWGSAVTQIFQVKVFVSRYQLFVPDSESVYQEVQKIIGHGAVIDETAYGTYLVAF